MSGTLSSDERSRQLAYQLASQRTRPTAQVFSQQPQSEHGRGVLGSALHLGGDVLGATTKYLSNPIQGAISKAVYSDPVWEGLGLRHLSTTPESQRLAIQHADSFTHAYRERAKTMNAAEKLLAGAVADPTTWLTAGTGGAILKGTGLAAKFPEADLGIRATLDLVDRAQALPIRAVTAPAKLLKTGVKAVKPEWFELGKRAQFAQTIDGLRTALEGAILSKNVKLEDLPNLDNSATTELLNTTRTRLDDLMSKGNVGAFQAELKGMSNTLLDQLETTSTGATQAAIRKHLTRTGRMTPVKQVYSETLAPDIANAATGGKQIGGVAAALKANDATRLTQELDSLVTTNGTPKWKQLRSVWDNLNNTKSDPGGLLKTEFENRKWVTIQQPGYVTRKNARFTGDIAAEGQARNDAIKAASRQSIDEVIQDTVTNKQITTTPEVENFVRERLHTATTLNPQAYQNRILIENPLYAKHFEAALASKDPLEAQGHLVNMLIEMNQRNAAFGVLHPKMREFMDRVSIKSRRSLDQTPVMSLNNLRVRNSVISDVDMQTLDGAYGNAEVQKLHDRFIDGYTKTKDIVQNHIPINDRTSAQEIWDLLDKNVITDPKERKVVEKFLNDWDLTPEAAKKASERAAKFHRPSQAKTLANMDIRTAYFDEILNKWSKEESARLGFSEKEMYGPMMAKLAWIPKAWREQALLSPRYHLANVMDMTFKSLINGINPVKLPGSAQEQIIQWGIRPPSSVYMAHDPVTLATFGANAATQAAQAGLPTGFEGKNAITGVGRIPLVGKPLDRVVVWNRQMSHALENSFRLTAWNQGTKDALRQLQPAYYAEVQRTLPGQVGVDTVKLLGDRGSARVGVEGIGFSADNVAEDVVKAGGTVEDGQRLAQLWSTQLEQASNYGATISDRIHFDYDNVSQLEENLKLPFFVPFHFFATRNLPFYLETLAADPLLLRSWYRYHELSDEEKISMGIPDRVEDMLGGVIPGGPANDGLMNHLFGPGQFLFNPLMVLSLAQQTQSLGDILEPDSGPDPPSGIMGGVGQVVKGAQALGVSVAPWVNYPLSAFGAYGPRDEQGSPIRAQPLISGAIQSAGYTGPGSELGQGALRGAMKPIREAATHAYTDTKTGSVRLDNAVKYTIIDWANDPKQRPKEWKNLPREVFVDASKDENNPIYKKALHTTRVHQFQNAMLGFVNPVTTKQVQASELETTQEQRDLGITQDDLYSDDPTMQAYIDRLKGEGSPATDQLGFGGPASYDTRTGQYVTSSGERLGDKTKGGSGKSVDYSWGGDIWGPDKPFPYSSSDLYQSYQRWRNMQPSHADTSEDAFFTHFNIPH